MALQLDLVRSELPGWPVHWHERVDSTMNVAAKLAAAGCPHMTAVGADEQTAGIGRHGHRWHSEPEAGLYISVVLRAGDASQPALMLALGLAVQQAIERTCGVAVDLRWPNDALCSGRKCAGVLAHLHDTAVIAGIGINVNHGDFPPELREEATSLRISSGRAVSRELLLIAVLEELDAVVRRLAEDGPAEILRSFARASSYVSGKRVVVMQDGETLRGVTAGLDAKGFLKLREDSGRETLILAGGVRPEGPR
ncbi:MAG: biotin--[acetyl-CoA-carboxylase] ligase [Bryobacteraceae bacterium]|nr:biotin--[acetyl-CoA-carboxylase] ligase [Bryobacteraceae bacterium]